MSSTTPSSTAIWEELAGSLQEEIAGYEVFVRELDHWQRSILSGQAEAIRQDLLKTEVCREQLAGLRSRTKSLMEAAAYQADPIHPEKTASLETILPSAPEALREEIGRMASVVNRMIDNARRLLRENHMILRQLSDTLSGALRTLLPQAGHPPSVATYSRPGGRVENRAPGTCMRKSL